MATMKMTTGMIAFGLVLVLSLGMVVELGQAYDPWNVMRTSLGSATATFYGGNDASGTFGGSCGYGNPYQTGYGVQTGALSNALYNNGLSCGACFELQCHRSASAYAAKWCYTNVSPIRITATNNCPGGSTGGWCDYPKLHFDLAYPAFVKMANPTAGVIPIQYRRVACKRSGGVRFTLNGNPYWNLVLVTNVGGDGNVAAISIKGSATSWCAMNRNWGMNWEAFVKLTGQSICFKVTTGLAKTLTLYEVVPKSWAFGQTFQSQSNFVSL